MSENSVKQTALYSFVSGDEIKFIPIPNTICKIFFFSITVSIKIPPSFLLSKKFSDSSIIIYDLSYNMMIYSRKKNIGDNISYINGSAEQMAIEDNCID